MKFFALVIIGFVVMANCDEKSSLIKFVVGNVRFSADVYKEVKATKTGNFLFCPLSAEIVLALTRIGAKGATGTQLSQALHLPDDTNEIQQIFSQLTPTLQSTNGYTLNSANKIYVRNGYQILEDFKKVARDSFSADVASIDFDAKQAAADKINQWVSKQTFDKIQNIIDSEMFTNETKTILVNALYFKSNWVTKFNEESTKTKPFFLNKKERIEVDMMESTAQYRFSDNSELKAKILEMPYEGGEYSMVIVLPHSKEGLTELENKIEEVLTSPVGFRVKVHVQIPKFKIQTEIQFTNVLKNLGVTELFDDDADLRGFSAPSEQPLKINDVVQKGVIEVDEKGTVAAAVTRGRGFLSFKSVRPQVREFNANHPFIYYIKGPNGVMFIGRYVKN